LPGLWSIIKRSVSYKPINKDYETDGPSKGKEVCCRPEEPPSPRHVETVGLCGCGCEVVTSLLPRFAWLWAAADENGLHFAQVRQTAAEIVAYFSAMNFTPEPSNDVMTFRGTMGRSRGQAFFLSFCTFLSLASLAIVLTIQVSQCFVQSQPSPIHLPTRRSFGRMTHRLHQFPLVEDVSQNSPWWYITLASPLAGVYYWLTASKEVTVQVLASTPRLPAREYA
jgi:hypothetical protein